ncbi:rifin PIR protein, putative [Plasmodium reichenowi]|uniref:Rifin PIR protein, putative n=1 Tax=Plasmodium reichenowi TaxID=5854 RepID=A0A2P9D1E1_PLARE|nr:rifin PIR protein, putative [Plasmodium reichenowi]
MKIHYINILLFVIPLNILAHNKNKLQTTSRHTPTTRLLCECELYVPHNYDNEPQMKEVMENFNKQTQQRFQEYDERMQSKRMKCKDKCDKEIQKIILKDKLEKQMEEQLTTLETKINTHDIPTCICKKSLADKTEKFCLNCGVNVGGGVTLSSGVLGGIGAVALSPWQTKAMAAATKYAMEQGALAGEAARIPAAIKAVFLGIKSNFPIEKLGFGSFNSLINERTYTNVQFISDTINTQYTWYCSTLDNVHDDYVYTFFQKLGHGSGEVSTRAVIGEKVTELVTKAKGAAETEAAAAEAAKKAAVLETSKKAIETTSYNWYTTISYSITAILIIVLIMVIIYLILRYRRKKRMKKKLQYIKLLEE